MYFDHTHVELIEVPFWNHLRFFNGAIATQMSLSAAASLRTLILKMEKEKTIGGWQFLPVLNYWVSLPC